MSKNIKSDEEAFIKKLQRFSKTGVFYLIFQFLLTTKIFEKQYLCPSLVLSKILHGFSNTDEYVRPKRIRC